MKNSRENICKTEDPNRSYLNNRNLKKTRENVLEEITKGLFQDFIPRFEGQSFHVENDY